MRKIVFFTFIILMSVFTSFGQERIDDPTYSFNNESNLITNITGWCFDEQEGKWVGNANYISCENKNIKSIQIKTFENNVVTNYVLIIAYNDGRHYSIREDWSDNIEYQVYSLTKDEYETIISPISYHVFTLPCITYDNRYEQRTDNNVIRQIICNNIKRKKNDLDIYELSIKRYNDVIRFNYQVENEYESFWNKRKTLEKEYFEIPSTEWEKLKIE